MNGLTFYHNFVPIKSVLGDSSSNVKEVFLCVLIICSIPEQKWHAFIFLHILFHLRSDISKPIPASSHLLIQTLYVDEMKYLEHNIAQGIDI